MGNPYHFVSGEAALLVQQQSLRGAFVKRC